MNVIVAEQLSCPALLGRDWLSVLSPNWSSNLLSGSLSNTNDCPVNYVSSPNENCQSMVKAKTDVVEMLSERFPCVYFLRKTMSCQSKILKSV